MAKLFYGNLCYYLPLFDIAPDFNLSFMFCLFILLLKYVLVACVRGVFNRDPHGKETQSCLVHCVFIIIAIISDVIKNLFYGIYCYYIAVTLYNLYFLLFFDSNIIGWGGLISSTVVLDHIQSHEIEQRGVFHRDIHIVKETQFLLTHSILKIFIITPR